MRCATAIQRAARTGETRGAKKAADTIALTFNQTAKTFFSAAWH